MDLESRVKEIKDRRKRKIIADIINKSKWYRYINFDTYISIMQDLGYSPKEAKELYIILNSKKD